MALIKNFDTLATTPLRQKALNIVEAGLEAIQPQNVLGSELRINNNELSVRDQKFNLDSYKRIFLVGFGKGSSGVTKYLEGLLGDRLTAGWDIDVVDETFKKIHYTKGTHPLPSQTNIDFTKNVLDNLTHLTENDLVLVVICGGGSALFESSTLSLEEITHLNDLLLKSGVTISEMNVVRKHVSKVKGGKFAKHLYPATVVSLIFSDVPGNDLSVIASGPTNPDNTTQEDLEAILKKYPSLMSMSVDSSNYTSTVNDEMYFKNVHNILVVSNKTALAAMMDKTKEEGLKPKLYSDRLQGDSKKIGSHLLNAVKKGEALLAGGETTITITGSGKGGRNQSLVLAALPYVESDTIIIAFDSDGMDYYGFAGAVGDTLTIEKAKKIGLNEQEYLDNDDSYTFFEKIGDGIDTGKLESNVSDLFVVIKQ